MIWFIYNYIKINIYIVYFYYLGRYIEGYLWFGFLNNFKLFLLKK